MLVKYFCLVLGIFNLLKVFLIFFGILFYECLVCFEGFI